MTQPDPTLHALADALGVATSYTDWRGRSVDVDPDTIRAVLRAMDVDASDPDAAAAALHARRQAEQRALPPTLVVRRGELSAGIAVGAAGSPRWRAGLRTADGDEVRLEAAVDGQPRLALPTDLPLGWHTLTLTADDAEVPSRLAVVPDRCPVPTERMWGWMLQLYSVRSTGSWGIGDLGDLCALASWSGHDLGADFALVNPLHASTPVTPVQSSPYYPSSRRFFDPLALRIEDVPELADLPGDARERVERLAAPLRAANRSERIDRDRALRAKLDAVALLLAALPTRRRDAFTRWRAAQGPALERFARFCALAERHGVPFTDWPQELRHPDAPAVEAQASELADRVTLHAYLQWLLDEQLAAAQRTALDAGMRIGVVHDLAVGVDPGGADAWALADDLARDVRVGAPPDPLAQRGQNWQQPPLRPDRLPETAYAPWREITEAVLRHAGGIRIDHVLGLFRLWWIPEGAEPTAGTYVRYPAEDLLGILALQATRAGAVVVGEDLGTVAPGVRETLEARGVLGSRVVYFERDEEGRPRRPGDYSELALASVTTHDLPTAAGWWTDEDVRVQAALDRLGADTDVETELERKASERAALLAMLAEEGLVGSDPDLDERIAALHRLLATCSSLLAAATPNDAVGDRDQPNLPGTTDEYPNWRLPLAEPGDGARRPLLLDELRDHPGVRRLAAVMARRTTRSAPVQSSGSDSH